MKHRLLLSVLTLALAGCAIGPDLPSGYALGEQAGEGLAVVSLTLSGRALEGVSSFEYRLRPVPPAGGREVERERHFSSARQFARWVAEKGAREAGARQRVVVKDWALRAPPDVVESGRAIGRVVALPLAEGDYELYDWKLVEPRSYGSEALTPREGQSYRFRVTAGRATYLGNLDLRLTEQGGYALTVADEARRDLALLSAKAPGVRTGDVAYRPGELTP